MRDINSRINGLSKLIGNTPLLAITLKYKGEIRKLYAKSENLNLTGSIKDRMALYILDQAYKSNKIKPGDTVVEATSGNTGISFSAISKALGHDVIIYMPDWMSRERVELIRSLGAKIMPVTKEQGGFVGSIEMTEKYAESRSDVFLPQQFSNQANVIAHEKTTGPEIWWQLHYKSMKPDAFVAGVGTGGTVMGTGRFLKRMDDGIRIFPVQPDESPILSSGRKVGSHRIQGISDEFIPDIVDLEFLDNPVSVSDGDSIIMAQMIASQLGLSVGISSGANLLGALKVQELLGSESIVVTVFPDDSKKYLSTDLLREEPVKKGYLSSDIELISYQGMKRVCHTCCEREECTQKFCQQISQEN